MVNLGGITSTLEKHASTIGTAGGLLAVLSADSGVIANITGAIDHVDVKGGINWLTGIGNYTTWKPGADAVKAAGVAIIGGWLLEEVGPSNMKRIGSALQKGGWGAAVGIPIGMFIMGLARPPQNNGGLFSGSGGSGSGGSAGYSY